MKKLALAFAMAACVLAMAAPAFAAPIRGQMWLDAVPGHYEDITEQVWVENWVTVVDEPAYTDRVADGISYYFPADGYTTTSSSDASAHSTYLIQNDMDANYMSQTNYTYVEVPAKTHQEDQGHYETRVTGQRWVVDTPGHYVPYTRLAGDYANETSAEISAEAFPNGSSWVVIARDDDFADALGATGLAGALNAPIVLTDRYGLSPAAKAEVRRLGAKRAYVIGGTGAVKAQVDSDLKALGVSVMPRVWGENSYDTSLACARKTVEHGGSSDHAIVAVSFNFQDALSISPYAYSHKVPVVLQTWGDTAADRGFTGEARAWLAGKELTVVGGTGAISAESLAGLNARHRLWGDDGYETSDNVAEWGLAHGWFDADAAVLACGAQAPKGTDALAGSALAGRLGCPVLLVSGNPAIDPVDLSTIDGWLSRHAGPDADLYVLGGTYVVPDSTVAHACKALG